MTTPLHRIAARVTSEERGVAMIVAIGALMVLLTLTALVAQESIHLSSTSNEDRNAKRAFQAAEGGLQVATYRLNKLAPLDSQCIANLPILASGCNSNGSLGNGATWSYHMTKVLTLGDNATCTGFPISYDPSSTTVSLAPRCITATGTVNGVSRRVQARVVLFKGQPIFPLGGIICLQTCSAGNAVLVHNGAVGANGSVNIGNSSSVANGFKLGPNATVSQGNSTNAISYRSNEEGPWVLSAVDVGNTATVNNNGNWTFGTGSTYTWSTTSRQLNMSKGTLTLKGGIYNFCSIDIGNNATVAVAQGAKAVIYIDSPSRTGSGCAAGTGYLDANNNFDNPNLNPDGTPQTEALQIYVYGNDPSSSKPAVAFNNSSALNAVIHAPNATVKFKNSAVLYGALNANKVDAVNSLDFTWGGQGVASLRTNATVSLFQRTAWRQCRSAPTTSNPGSGC
jgi:hypothetical protein